MINAALLLSCAASMPVGRDAVVDKAPKKKFAVVKQPARPRLPPPIRVASFNILAGRFGLDRVAAAIEEMDVDLIGLQEVDRNTRRSGGVDQAAELARRLGMQQVFAAALPFDGGEYGVALLSRGPLRRVRVRPLPVAPGTEPRVLLMARAELAGQHFVVATTHLSAAVEGEAALAMHRPQARAIAEALGGRERCILLADLNAEAGSIDLSGLNIVGSFVGLNAGPTYPARDPTRRIDHILASPDLYSLAAQVHTIVASDHRAVSAQIGRRLP